MAWTPWRGFAMWSLTLLLLLPLLDVAGTCHPECSYECDNPVCAADCRPVCLPPVCAVCLNTTGTPVCYGTDKCWLYCPVDQCESDECPACATMCPNSTCNGFDDCFMLCEEPECSWECQKPTNCPLPTCLLQCEMPACPHSSTARLFPAMATIVAALSLSLCMIHH